LVSKSKRFGGLSGLSIGADKELYAVSDRGDWVSASLLVDPNSVVKDVIEWRIAPILTSSQAPVSGRLITTLRTSRFSTGRETEEQISQTATVAEPEKTASAAWSSQPLSSSAAIQR
jgi:hypothetical protein